MKRKTLALGIAAALGIGMVSTASATIFGNNSQKGSLLIYPRIDVSANLDTLITLTNDSAAAVRVKCFYATSDPMSTPFSGSAKSLKHFNDFTIDLTHNQPISWLADDGFAVNNSQKSAGQIAPAFGFYPDGAEREVGELKCWAVTDDGASERSYNHLFGTVSVLDRKTLQAYEYTAWAFQANSPTGTVSTSPGVLTLGSGGGVVVGTQINGTDSLAQNFATGVICGGDLAVGVTCNNNVSLSGTGSVIWDGGATGNFTLAVPGLIANDTQLTSNLGNTYSFTSANGNFTGMIIAITTGGGGNQRSLTDILLGTFTPSGTLSGFTAGPANLTLAYTETINPVTGGRSFSISETIASPPDVIPFGYDACPNILLGNFTPTGAPEGPEGPTGSPNTQITLASCNQDLRQNFTPTVTKLTWTFWNQDEQARTGTHKCADSWYETDFTDDVKWPFAQWKNLGTNAAYFRIETTADTSICAGAVTSSYVGVIRESFDLEVIDEETGKPVLSAVRGTNLTGRGVAPGVIKYDPSIPDSFKPTH